MTGVATPAPERVGERPVEPAQGEDGRPPAGESRGGGESRRSAGSRLGVELALFAALGALGVSQWSRLVADPPLGGLLLALALVIAGGAAVGAIGARRERLPYPRLASVAIVLCTTAAAMVAVGLPARLLLPGNWAELIDNLSLGLAGIEDTEMPYDGGDVWLRLTLMLGAPLLLGLAAALAFWPARRRTPGRILALGVLVLVYGIAVTLDSPPAELAWGVVLLLLAAAWLWVPRLAPRRAAVALATAAGAGLLALPVAAVLDTEAPWWDYESWDWFGRDREVTFDWNHSYGPLDWPQEGTTLLEVRSVKPLYWKASVLDRFDGFTWQRAHGDDALSAAERLARPRVPGARLPDLHRNWLTQASFEVESLESGLAIGAGTPQAIQGVEGVSISSDGTSVAEQPLQTGDEYSVVAYVPQPNERRLRRAPARYPAERFGQTTLVGLPATVEPTADAGPTSSSAGPGEAVDEAAATGGFAPSRARAMPLWGTRDPDARAAVLGSPYAGVYRLARRLTAGAATPYAAVRAVEDHLRQGYDYSPTVPDRTYPLAGFLFADESGYCQQFAGTMALMLRMVGIPARVVSGFAPGSLDEERGVYEVRDTDAHSWVEVYFRGIGWVTFDPTPAAAPAASQTLNAGLGTFFRGRGAIPAEGRGRARSLERALEGGALGPIGDDRGPWATIALALLGTAALAATAAGIVFMRRRRTLLSGEAVDAQLDEFRRALTRLGWSVPPAPTLLGLEQRFHGAGRTAVAGYAAGLRAHRYAPEAPAPPGPAARRALRRALRGSGGLRRRLRALLAIPPGGPR
jgi:transglutaminase-like putative cysteine protease